jgi:Arc/MetJ family transcription regulator
MKCCKGLQTSANACKVHGQMGQRLYSLLTGNLVSKSGGSKPLLNSNIIYTGASICWYTIHMKRTTLMLDAQLLDEATRILRVKTYSAAVNAALQEALRVRRIQRLPEFFGTDLWEGNLADMREDRPYGRRNWQHRNSK